VKLLFDRSESGANVPYYPQAYINFRFVKCPLALPLPGSAGICGCEL
jgi:hypothetical protein